MGLTVTGLAPRPLARIILTIAALALLGPAPASAQWFGFVEDRPIPPGRIVRSLLSQGFIEIGRPRFNGEVYTIHGIDRRGARVRLVIDAYDGDIVARTRLDGPLVPPREVGREARVDPRQPPPEMEEMPAPKRVERGPRRAEPPRQQRQATRSEPKASPAAPLGNEGAGTPSVSAAPVPPVESKAVAPVETPSTAALPTSVAKPPAPAPQAPAAPALREAKPAESTPAEAAPARSVRVIQGVTPVIPQPNEPPKFALEEPPAIPPITIE